MANDNFKKLLDESLKPLQESLDEARKDIKEVKETQEDHTRRLEALSGDMEHVLSEVKAYTQ